MPKQLRKREEKAKKTKLQSLYRKYESIYHVILVNKMIVYGEKILNNKVVDNILRTTSIKFDHVVATIIESHNINIMTLTELQGSTKSHVSRI
ncbi:hypothetical protein CR513_12925, partial [Mucuna pruriens]